MLNNLALEALRAFVEGGSIAEAAFRIHRSPSQTSRMLAGLEQELGFPLLVKEGRRLLLTDEGVAFYTRVERMLRAGDDAADHVRSMRRRNRNHVTVLAAQHLVDGLLLDAVARATAENNAFGVTINARMRRDVDNWISQQQFDVALAQWPVSHPLLAAELLAPADAVVVLGRDDPRAALAVLTPHDLGDGRYIGLPDGGSLGPRYARSFAAAGFEPRPYCEVSFGHMAGQLAARGCGAALSDPVGALAHLHLGARIRRYEPRTPVDYGLVFPKSKPPSDATQMLVRHLRDVVREKLEQAGRLLAA